MSFFEDQEADWFANNCKGAPDDYDGCGGGLAPWKDHFTGEKPPRKLSKSAKRRARKQRSEARKLAEKKEA